MSNPPWTRDQTAEHFARMGIEWRQHSGASREKVRQAIMGMFTLPLKPEDEATVRSLVRLVDAANKIPR